MSLEELRKMILEELERDMGDEEAKTFAAASEHPYTCRCDSCRLWWKSMGADEDGLYGPFAKEEIEDADSD